MSKKQLVELLKLAERYLRQPNYALAKAVLEKILQAYPDNARANELLAYAIGNNGDLQGAIIFLEKAIASASCSPTAHYELGSIYLSRDEDEKAITSFEEASRLGFRTFELHFKYGQSLAKLGLFHRAIEQFLLAKNKNESSAELFFNLAKLHEYLGDYTKALQDYERVIGLDPAYTPALIGVGRMLKNGDDRDAALNAFNKALALDASDPEALYLKGNLLRSMKRYAEAIEVYASCLKVAPDLPFLFGAYVNTKLLICDWGDYDKNLEKIKQDLLDSREVIPPFPLLALVDDPSLQLLAANTWVRYETKNSLPFLAKPSTFHAGKIRIGYFSADFGFHPVAFLIAEVFELHNRDQFEVFGFSTGPNTGDPMRKRLEEAFDEFIDAENLSDLKVAERARELEIDIAIDLTGFTQDGRTNIFALGVAPVQVNFLGYPGTLGAPYMDYIIADPILIPSGSERFCAEKIAYLPDTYQPNDRKRPRLVGRISRAEAGLPKDGFVFCCFNNNFKITPGRLDLWAAILRQVESGYLWLLEDNPLASNNLRHEIQKRGVDPDRLIFAPRVSPEEHLARMASADLFLDTAPYNAHTTTSDALWVGLPVLSVIGKSIASRVAASLIFAADLPELVVETDEAYVELAVELAGAPYKLEALRDRLLTSYQRIPLFDTVKFTKNLENLYCQMHKKSQFSLPPSEITAFER